MICCRGVTKGGGQRWSVAVVTYVELKSSEWRKLQDVLEHRSCQDGIIFGAKSDFCDGQDRLREDVEWWSPLVAWTRGVILWGSIFDHYRCPLALSLVGACRRESGRAELVIDSLVPQARIDTRKQRKIWIIIVDSSGLTRRSRCWLTAGVSIDSVPWNL